ncbi:unnamed protein product [Trichobilharzia regenti]|nr:unnamed protein product [Trichobilharzia regenti]
MCGNQVYYFSLIQRRLLYNFVKVKSSKKIDFVIMCVCGDLSGVLVCFFCFQALSCPNELANRQFNSGWFYTTVLPIQSKMADPTGYGSWCGVLNVGMIIVVCLNLAIGFYGFLRFGENSEGSITLNIPQFP